MTYCNFYKAIYNRIKQKIGVKHNIVKKIITYTFE